MCQKHLCKNGRVIKLLEASELENRDAEEKTITYFENGRV